MSSLSANLIAWYYILMFLSLGATGLCIGLHCCLRFFAIDDDDFSTVNVEFETLDPIPTLSNSIPIIKKKIRKVD